MKTKLWAIILVIFITFLTSSAQIFYKLGAEHLEYTFISLITNYYLLIGLVLYGIGAALIIVAFKGGEVSVLYPIIATSYIWVSLISGYLFHEIVNVYKWLGIIVIIIGISLISFGSKEKESVTLVEGV